MASFEKLTVFKLSIDVRNWSHNLLTRNVSVLILIDTYGKVVVLSTSVINMSEKLISLRAGSIWLLVFWQEAWLEILFKWSLVSIDFVRLFSFSFPSVAVKKSSNSGFSFWTQTFACCLKVSHSSESLLPDKTVAGWNPERTLTSFPAAFFFRNCTKFVPNSVVL